MRESKCRGIPSKPAFLTGHGTLPAQKPGRRESPSGDSADKMTRETCSGKSSNGREKRPRSRRENVSVTGFFHTSPEIKIPSPGILFSGLGISLSGPEISRRAAPKVNDSDKILHRSPVLCKKIARKSAIWAGLCKSRVTKIIQNGTICLFSQAFHDILTLRLRVYQNKLLRLVGKVARSAGGVSRPQRHTLCVSVGVKLCCDGFEIRRNLRCGFPNPQARKGLHEAGNDIYRQAESFFRIENPDIQLRGITNPTRQTSG